jgi:FMN-dependent NADH-azoreductase
MVKILHIDSSITDEGSVSRKVSAAVVQALTSGKPDANVIYRDLGAHPLPHLTLADLHDHHVVDEFLAANIIVIGAPMYNFTVPTNLKAWLDRIAIAGKTFQYGGSGPAGLAGGRKVIVASTRGGFYGEGSPMADYELQDRYLRTFFGFLGIDDITFVNAEGLGMGEAQREQATQAALEKVSAVAA